MKMPVFLVKRKFAITAFCTIVGAVIAFTTGASINDWSFFTMAVIGTFGVTDVADKKLNGGKYDERAPRSSPDSPGQNGS